MPVSSIGSYQVQKVGSSEVKIVSSIPAPKKTAKASAKYVLPLNTGVLPPVGASVFQVRLVTMPYTLPATDVVTDHRSLVMEMKTSNGDVEYSNGLIKVVFDGYVSWLLCVRSFLTVLTSFPFLTFLKT